MKIVKFTGTLLLISLVMILVACTRGEVTLNLVTRTAESALKTLNSYPFLAPTPSQPDSTAQPSQSALTPTLQPALKLPDGFQRYFTIAGDTLAAVASHFGVDSAEILSISPNVSEGYLPAGTELGIPSVELQDVLILAPALPDSEIVYGPGTSDFDPVTYANQADGFLTRYTETIDGVSYSGQEIVQKVARDTSTNPRLLLAILDFRSDWVSADPPGADKDRYPIGFGASDAGLYNELLITAKVLAQGFYGWRDGSLTSLRFFDGVIMRINPSSNAGSVAIANLFAILFNSDAWYGQLYGSQGFLNFYQVHYGDAWQHSQIADAIVDEAVRQPELALPFLPGLRWSLTAGAHTAWHTGTPRGALDFAPVTGEAPCAVSTAWVTASASGQVVRSGNGVVAIDLDGDGDEGTGWVVIYLHVAEKERVAQGVWVERDEPIGHPSCERGRTTGTHVHITRKYNGQWIGVEGPLPFILSGWQAYAGEGYYQGTLQRDGEIITASSSGLSGSSIFRD